MLTASKVLSLRHKNKQFPSPLPAHDSISRLPLHRASSISHRSASAVLAGLQPDRASFLRADLYGAPGKVAW